MTEKLTAKEVKHEQALNLPSEHAKQAALFNWARDASTIKKYPEVEYMYSVPNGGLRKVTVAKKLKAEGVKPGVWDVHLDAPRNGYSGLRIEMKHGYNKLTENQVKWGKHWESEGFKCIICYSHLEAVDVIEEYLRDEMTINKNISTTPCSVVLNPVQ